MGGIDPGKQGFTSILMPDGSVESWATPTVGDKKQYDLGGMVRIVQGLKRRNVRIVILERQQPAYVKEKKETIVNSMVRASFKIGYGYALWQMALFMAGVPHEVVMPGVWKKRMGITVPSTVKGRKAREKEAKARAIRACEMAFPTVDLRRSERARTPSADKAESILLAQYGVRYVLGTL